MSRRHKYDTDFRCDIVRFAKDFKSTADLPSVIVCFNQKVVQWVPFGTSSIAGHWSHCQISSPSSGYIPSSLFLIYAQGVVCWRLGGIQYIPTDIWYWFCAYSSTGKSDGLPLLSRGIETSISRENPDIPHLEIAEITVYQCFAGILLFLAVERPVLLKGRGYSFPYFENHNRRNGRILPDSVNSMPTCPAVGLDFSREGIEGNWTNLSRSFRVCQYMNGKVDQMKKGGDDLTPLSFYYSSKVLFCYHHFSDNLSSFGFHFHKIDTCT